MCHNPAMVPVVISPNRLTSLGYVIGANIPKPADTMNKTLIDDSLTHDCLAYPDLVYIPHVKPMICDIIPSYTTILNDPSSIGESANAFK